MEKVHFITQGCSANQSETEIMEGILKKAGYEIAADKNDAQVNIINICTVKGNATALQEIKAINELHKKIIVTGCITRHIIPEIRKHVPDASFLSTHNILQIADVVDEAAHGNVVEIIEKQYGEKVCLPRVRRNPIIGITPILNSCNSCCTFCSTKLVKGKLFSYPIHNIVSDIEAALDEGCKEIWLTSQDNAAYMLDKTNISQLAALINTITHINKHFYLRIGMMNPSDLLPILDDLIEAYQDQKVFKFAHIPLQSGNSEILEKMKRRYSIDEFLQIVNEMRAKIKHLTLATDVIAGFPTESEAQFLDTCEVIKKISPDVINISRFQKREGTVAAKMPQVHGNISKERSRMMTELFHKVGKERNEQWLGWKGSILVDEHGKNNTLVGRNFAYKPVIVKRTNRLGDEIEVKVKEATSFDLRAE